MHHASLANPLGTLKLQRTEDHGLFHHEDFVTPWAYKITDRETHPQVNDIGMGTDLGKGELEAGFDCIKQKKEMGYFLRLEGPKVVHI